MFIVLQGDNAPKMLWELHSLYLMSDDWLWTVFNEIASKSVEVKQYKLNHFYDETKRK